jgi:hypothetical protein
MTGWPPCKECDDSPAFVRCDECGAVPIHVIEDDVNRALAEIARDMCAEAVERELRFTMELQRKDLAA